MATGSYLVTVLLSLSAETLLKSQLCAFVGLKYKIWAIFCQNLDGLKVWAERKLNLALDDQF
uniref:Uncharacterized protein n=1 Tax=Rhizophora mucronata TaxID=61149 RepID=A0A2P2MZK4_RHIMU